MPSPADKAPRKQARESIDALVRAAEAQFPGQQARLDQLRAHAATVAMCLDLLYDSTSEERGDGQV